MRLLLVAGAGGVGTTTAAHATAALAARTAKVLLVSADAPAAPDGDLRVLRVDVRRRFEERWPQLAGVAATAIALRDFWSYDARTDEHAVAEREARQAAGES